MGLVYAFEPQIADELRRGSSVGVNYQPVINPAYNRDRGPVHIFTGRVHVAF